MSLALAVTLAAAEIEQPHLIASVHLMPMTSFPDLLGAQVTVHAIPWVDLQGGISGLTDRFGWYVRGGIRYLFNDWRDETHVGLTWRFSLLAGYRAMRDPKANAAGFSGLLATDFAYFFKEHLAFTVQLAFGGLWDNPFQRVLPELRLGVGVSF